MSGLVSGVKHRLLPTGSRPRRLIFGIARGLRLEVDFAIQTKMYLGLYEIELNRYLRRMCAVSRSSFDVGGQFGYDALVMAKLSRGHVVSFECEKAACDDILRNVNYNGRYGGKIEVVHAFVTARTDPIANELSLDEFVMRPGRGVPDFIKMDIEGAEYDALCGARNVLAAHQPSLLVETHASTIEEQCLDLVESFGYRTKVVDHRRWLPDYRPALHNRWFIAVHPKRAETSSVIP